jgi:UDP-sugar transporter A1/2/3
VTISCKLGVSVSIWSDKLTHLRKGFATSISIVLSFLASVALFNYPITLAFCVGSSIVLAATYLYNAPAPAHSAPRTTIGVDPGSPISHTAPILGEPERPSRASSFVSLLGLGSGSNASSRKPSATDLRTQFAGSSGGFTQVSPNMGSANGGVMGLYAAPATDGPYLNSAHQSDSSLSEKRQAQGL